VGFAYLIRGRNEENNSILADVTSGAHTLRALLFSLSLPFEVCHAGYTNAMSGVLNQLFVTQRTLILVLNGMLS